jgi:Protein of unknown function (DUF4199)
MEKVSTARIALKWGLICALIAIAFSTISFTSGLWKNILLGFFVSIILYFTIIGLAFNEFKKTNEGLMSFSQGLNIGSLLSLTAGMLSFGFDMFYKNIFDPNILNEEKEMAREFYSNFGTSKKQIETTISQMESVNTINLGSKYFFGVLGILFLGFLASLIMSAIMKKEKSIFD